MDPEVLDDTPEVLALGNVARSLLTDFQMIHNIPQPRFEQFVAEQLAGDTNVEIRKGVAFVSCVQVTLPHRSTFEYRPEVTSDRAMRKLSRL